MKTSISPSRFLISKTAALITLFVAITLNANAKIIKCDSVPGDPMKALIYTLDNGLTVYLTANDEKPRIQTYIAVKTGSRNDPAETTGLAHYLEHLMFKGTQLFGTSDYQSEKPLLDDIESRFEHYRTVSDSTERKRLYHEIDSVSFLAAQYNIPNEYDKLMAAIGSQGSNAFTSNDLTCYLENIPSNELENYLKVQADRFQNMVIRGFHTELEAVYEEKNISLAKDMQKSIDALYALLFPNHPYGTQTTLGSQEHLKNPSITNIKNYFSQYYAPNNIAVCMSGDLDPDSTIALIDKYLGNWKPNPDTHRPEFPLIPLTQQKDSSVVGQEAENIIIAWRFPGAAELSTDTLDLICQLIANGRAGLFEIDLEQTMKLQAVSASLHSMTDYSAFLLYALPNAGQSLEEVRTLLLDEMDKMKNGLFDDNLLQAVKNNMKLSYFRSLLNNSDRAMQFVDAFVNGRDWETQSKYIDRIDGMTKQQIVKFLNDNINDNFVCIYKRQGTDSNDTKIAKPQITPIPANRDLSSQFLKDIQNSDTQPIKPKFIDFNKDLDILHTDDGMEILYKHNPDDQLFNLSFIYDIGSQDIKDLPLVSSYLYYIGTDSMSSAEIKQALYALACDYSVSVGADEMAVSLSGLSENMNEALQIVENFLLNAKGDSDAWNNYVQMINKNRNDAKKNQKNCFAALSAYGIYGQYNPNLNQSSIEQLDSAGPQYLTKLLKNALNTKHKNLYFGPYSKNDILNLLNNCQLNDGKQNTALKGNEYAQQIIEQNEVIVANYDAPNIYMIQYANSGIKQPDPTADNYAFALNQALILVFNEYFGGGMNSIVFQELREARALAYSASARFISPNEIYKPEYFTTSIISQNDKMNDCITTFNSIINNMPLSDDAFDLAKQSLIKNIESRRVTRANILNSYVNAQKIGINYDLYENIYQILPDLSLNDLKQFEISNVANKPTRYIILGNVNEIDLNFLNNIGNVIQLDTKQLFP